MAAKLCPLNSFVFLRSISTQMKLSHVKEIEDHLSSSSSRCPHPPLKDLTLNNGFFQKKTPLLLACQSEKLYIVKHIVENWKVDIQPAANYYPNATADSMIKATPLFVVAYNGHGDIVRYLLEKGADVSAETSSSNCPQLRNSTPLQGVFMKFHLREGKEPSLAKIREEITTCNTITRLLLEAGAVSSDDGPLIWSSPWCAAESAITLLTLSNMDLNGRSSNGTTMLHHWASRPMYNTEEESLKVVKLLLEKGADPMAMDNEGFTPILIAAKRRFLGGLNNQTVLDFLLERGDIGRKEKIEALELAGAVILGDTKNVPLFERGFGYWREALRLRDQVTDGFGPLCKTPLVLKNGQNKEWITADELEDVIQHPPKYEIQAILVQLRIISAKSSKAPFESLYDFFEHCYPKLRSQRRISDLDILWFILETIRRSKTSCQSLTLDVVEMLITTLSNLEMDDPLLNLETIKTSLQLILDTCRSHLDNLSLCDRVQFVLLSMFLAALLLQLDEDIKRSLFQLVRHIGPDEDGQPLLHLLFAEVSHDKLLVTLDLLIKVGAIPYAADGNGNTLLHLMHEIDQEFRDPVARLLLDSGACLLQTNKRGKTVKDVWIENEMERRSIENQGALEWNDLPSWIRDTIPKLKCMSARMVRAHQLPYKDLAITLHPFIEKH